MILLGEFRTPNLLTSDSHLGCGSAALRQCHVPDFRTARLACRSLDFERHDEFAGPFIMVRGVTFRRGRFVAEIPQPRGDVAYFPHFSDTIRCDAY